MQGDKAVAKISTVPANLEDSCKQAKDECPVEAIIIS
jgi:ferredoxin